MNERIKELAEQANLKLDELPDDTFIPLEKFAESIILEAVNAVMDGTKEGDHYAQRIEQHFNNGTGGILHYGDKE